MPAVGPDGQPAAGDPNAAGLDLDDAENPQDTLNRATFVNVFVQGPPWCLLFEHGSTGTQPASFLLLTSGSYLHESRKGSLLEGKKRKAG